MKMKIGSESQIKEKKSKQVEDLIQNDFHKLSFEDLSKRFSVSLTNGLEPEVAANLLLKNGKNVLSQCHKNVFLKAISYLFTGFCGILWIAAIICILAWKPIVNV
jgi:sodium/potassium-transporting ATPase subunit alpha